MDDLPIAGTPGPGGSESIRRFRTQLTVLVLCYTIAVYAGIFLVARELMIDGLRAECASYASLVLDMRNWNASHGGVWIAESPDAEVNPYLEELGVTARQLTAEGVPLVLRNPSAMTSEIGDLTYQRAGVRFHLTSEQFLDPDNAPDEWEKAGLRSIEDVDDVVFGHDTLTGTEYYRYLRPLAVDESCLTCHASQGYRVGDLRGALSVSIPAGPVTDRLARLGMLLAALAAITLLVAIGTVRFLATCMQRGVDDANRQLRDMAVTDALTGVANRGACLVRLEQEYGRARRLGEDLSVISLDLDHFKRVNDTFGHGVGDCALRGFAERVTTSIRAYDVLGRVGGEEFLVIVPGGEATTARQLAERILENLRSHPVPCKPPLTLTASAGVATLGPQDASVDTLLARADDALYEAKRLGRDRVVTDDGMSEAPEGRMGSVADLPE